MNIIDLLVIQFLKTLFIFLLVIGGVFLILATSFKYIFIVLFFTLLVYGIYNLSQTPFKTEQK